MAGDRVRIVLLCEDRAQERLLRPQCRRRWGRDPRVIPLPAGKGSAEAWVRSQYAREVRLLRAKGQENVGLIVVTDGDNVGVATRKAALATELQRASLDARSQEERIAICVPTWSIETWILGLNGTSGVVETVSYKSQRKPDATAVKSAANAWPGSPAGCRLPSFEDALGELARIDR